VEPEALVEYRYRAVCEVLGGSAIGEVAVRFGTSRQSIHTWRRRFEQEGLSGLADRSSRPHSSPARVCAETEALTCQLRRMHAQPCGSRGRGASCPGPGGDGQRTVRMRMSLHQAPATRAGHAGHPALLAAALDRRDRRTTRGVLIAGVTGSGCQCTTDTGTTTLLAYAVADDSLDEPLDHMRRDVENGPADRGQ
jgi:hypothetical protein